MIKPTTTGQSRPAGLKAVGLAFGLVCSLAACGITAPRHSEGYADLDSLGVFDTDRTMALSIGPALIRIAVWATNEDDPKVAELLRRLDGVRIRIYEINGDAGRVAERTREMSLRLQARDWQPVMLVQEEGEQTNMLVRSGGERILGLTLITSDDEEAVVINVMGNLDPAHFSEAMVALSVDAPEVEVAGRVAGG